MGRTKKRGRGARIDDTGEVWAKIVSQRSTYFISGNEFDDEPRIDDEAVLELIAIIDAITTPQRKHLGQQMDISFLAATRYVPKEDSPPSFFGSVNLRGSQRSALAYLPSTPFWALPGLIAGRDAWIRVGWTVMRRGHAHLDSVFIGDAEDRRELLELGGNALATGI